jgi:O-acetylhomoserine/O-acetylserine sulfhydrylase-like pyridoxal-dependent enzyme
MAAIFATIMALVKSGDHIVASRNMFPSRMALVSNCRSFMLGSNRQNSAYSTSLQINSELALVSFCCLASSERKDAQYHC